MEVVFRRNPGLFFDLYRILVMKLNNRNKWINRIAGTDHENEDIAYTDYYLNQFEDPDPDLAIFFYLRDRRSVSYFAELYVNMVQEVGEKLQREDFLNYFDDIEKIKSDLCGYYLGKCIDPHNLYKVSEEINNQKNLEGKIKFLLLSFFINAEVFIQKLKETINQYADALEKIYNENAQKLIQWQESFDIESVNDKINMASTKKKLKNRDLQQVFVSFVIVDKNAVTVFPKEKKWYILGKNYDASLMENIELEVDIEKFGNAFGDRNRAKIIEFILTEGEQSSGEIAKKLGIALNTVSYHLDIMKRANLLCSRNLGKTTYYWLNTKLCEKAVDMISGWIRGEY